MIAWLRRILRTFFGLDAMERKLDELLLLKKQELNLLPPPEPALRDCGHFHVGGVTKNDRTLCPACHARESGFTE